jgi:hypothetical protein
MVAVLDRPPQNPSRHPRNAMRKTLALCALLPAAALHAQNPTEYVIYGGDWSVTPTNYEIRRTVDMDQDGLFLSAGEGWLFATDGSTRVSYVEQMRYEPFQGTPAVFGVSADDIVMKMVDLDGDGVCLSPGELIAFADHLNTHGGTSSRLKGLDFDPVTSELYVSDDYWISSAGGPQVGSGITRYTDLDLDGLALSAGEAQLFVDGQGTHSVAGIGGAPVTIGVTDFEALMVDSNGIVIAFEQQDLVLYAFQDQNGDGDAMDPGEAWNFLNLIDDVPGLEVNADVVAGLIPNPGCLSSSGAGMYGSLEGLNVDHGTGTNGGDVYWITSTTSSSCSPGNGMVFRGEDLNNDGDLNDTGEVVLYLDPNVAASYMLYPPSFLFDCYSHDGGISVFQADGPMGLTQAQNAVYFLKDNNGDGDASDNGEQTMTYAWGPDGCYGVSIAAMPAGAFVGFEPAYFEILGTGGTTSGGNVLSIGHVGDPWMGASVDITLTGANPSSQAELLLGWSDSQYGNFSLPLDLGFIGAPGNTLYTSLDYRFPTVTNAGGTAAKTFTVPTSAAFDGRNFYMQWHVIDPLANPRGSVLSDYLHGVVH